MPDLITLSAAAIELGCPTQDVYDIASAYRHLFIRAGGGLVIHRDTLPKVAKILGPTEKGIERGKGHSDSNGREALAHHVDSGGRTEAGQGTNEAAKRQEGLTACDQCRRLVLLVVYVVAPSGELIKTLCLKCNKDVR